VPRTFQAKAEDAGKRLDVFLVEKLETTSRARVQQLHQSGQVLVNGAPARASYRLRGGERVSVAWAPPPELRAYPEDIPLEILYEDDDLAAVNKPAGMAVHAGAGRHTGTLVNALLHRFGTLSKAGGELRPGIVHRLDRQTSGVLLVAKSDEAHRALAAQFQKRTVEKTYQALVQGTIKQDKGRVAGTIARDLRRRRRMTGRRRSGREAVTEYRVLERFPLYTLLEVNIHTGRTHQIRVHLSEAGHPVAGDTLYGAAGGVLDRDFLHATRIAFDHPRTGARMEIVAPLPPELRRFLDRLRV
jgi:23S rRNA pseudouridine1911/1915/1917 synthase